VKIMQFRIAEIFTDDNLAKLPNDEQREIKVELIIRVYSCSFAVRWFPVFPG